MPECRIVPAEPADIQHITDNLRPEHVREVRGQTDVSVAGAVRLSVTDSRMVFAGRAEGKTLFICGVSRGGLLADVGSVWMLATPEIDAYALEAATALRELFKRAHALAGASVLEQFIPHWYIKGVKWLLWLGWRAEGTRMICGNAHIRMVHKEGGEWA